MEGEREIEGGGGDANIYKKGYTVNKPKTDSAFGEHKTPLTKSRPNLFFSFLLFQKNNHKKAQLGNAYKRKKKYRSLFRG